MHFDYAPYSRKAAAALCGRRSLNLLWGFMKQFNALARFAALILAFVLCQETWALAGTTGGISGVVTSQTGSPLASVTVTASSPSQAVIDAEPVNDTPAVTAHTPPRAITSSTTLPLTDSGLIVDGEVGSRRVICELPFGEVRVLSVQHSGDILKPKPETGQLWRIDIHANRGKRASADRHLPHAPDLGESLLKDCRGRVVHPAAIVDPGSQRQDHDRRVSRIDLPIGRVGGKVRRQVGAGRVGVLPATVFGLLLGSAGIAHLAGAVKSQLHGTPEE